MNRKELVETLSKLEPALAKSDVVAQLACVNFGGKGVHAYDEVTAVVRPYSKDFKPEVRGGVRGKVLLDFLRASKAKDVEFEASGDGDLVVKAGRAKWETTVLPEDSFVFKDPGEGKGEVVNLAAGLLPGLALVSVSMGRDPNSPERLGVTASVGGKGAVLFATDNKTACRVRVGTLHKKDEGELTSLILPPRFVDLLLGISKDDPPAAMTASPDWVRATFESGLILFARAVNKVDVEGFAQLFSQADSGITAKLRAVPKGIDRCLERACVVIPHAKEPFTKVSSTGEKLRMHTASSAGDVKDVLGFDGPKAAAEVDPELVRRGLKEASELAVTDDFLCLKGEGYTYLVSAVQRAGEVEE